MKSKIITLALLLAVFYSEAQVELESSYLSKKQQIVCSAFSHDSRFIASGCFNSKILIWNNKGEVINELIGLKDFPLSLVFSKDGNYLISGGKDSKVTIWSLKTNSILFTMKGHSNDIMSVDISNNNIIASGSKDKTIRLWDLQGNQIGELKEHTKEVTSVKFSEDGEKLVSGCADGTIKQWDVRAKTAIMTIKAHEGWTRSVTYNYNGTLIASGGDDGKIQIWNANNGDLQNSIIAHSKWVQTIAFSPDGKYLLSGGHDNYLVLINVNLGTIAFNSPAQSNYVLSVAFNPNGKNFISSTLFSEKIDVWDASALGIKGNVDEIKVSKTKASIAWETANNSTTENLTYKLKASIVSESDVSSVDLFLNDKKFATDRFLNYQDNNKILYDKVVYLNSGSNNLKLVAYNDAGESTSEILKVVYSPPKENIAAVQTKTPEKTQQIDKKETTKESEKVATPAKIETAKIPSDELLKDLTKNKENPYRFALIIGNEDYTTYQTGLQSESNVAYAINDAKAFREYAINILGVPMDNIIFLTNARAIEMDNAIGKLPPIIKALNGKAEIFFFYAGHGFPDEQTKEPYIIPVDVSGTNLKYAIKIKELYASLSEAPSKKITVFLDACFSGGAREQGLLSARGVKIKPKENPVTGNMVVFTASSGNESALPYKDKQHGLFTYLLLTKLKETKGDISYKELSDFLIEQVGVKSVMINNKPQTPQTNVSFEISKSWGTWNIVK